MSNTVIELCLMVSKFALHRALMPLFFSLTNVSRIIEEEPPIDEADASGDI